MKVERIKYHNNWRMIGIKLGYSSSKAFPQERHWQLWVLLWTRGYWIYGNPKR